jgi:hypothetical protein
MRLALILGFCASLLAAPAAAAPAMVSASYEVTLNGMRIAVMNEQFESGEGKYRIVSDTTPIGVAALVQRGAAKLISTGDVVRAGLRPRVFEGTRGTRTQDQVSAEFDWREGKLTLKHEGRVDVVPLSSGAQDRLSALYQFMFQPPRDVKQVEFEMTNGRKIDRYRYAVNGSAELQTALGTLKTIHLVKVLEPGDNGAEIWLSPQHGFAPVKVVIVDNGARYEQVVTRIEFKS